MGGENAGGRADTGVLFDCLKTENMLFFPETSLFTSLPGVEAGVCCDEFMPSTLGVLRGSVGGGNDLVSVVVEWVPPPPPLPPPPEKASAAAATRPTVAPTSGLGVEADELDVDDVNRLPPPRRPGTGGIPLVPADPLLALVGGADGPVDVVVDERTRCMADAAAEVDIPSPPLLAPSRLSNSGRDWKYSSSSPKNASFSCADNRANTIMMSCVWQERSTVPDAGSQPLRK